MNAFIAADALLVIDMQRSFLHPEGVMRARRGRTLVDMDRTIERNAEAVAVAKAHSLPIIYTRHCYRPGYLDAGVEMRKLFEAMNAQPLLAGSWDAEVIDELGVDDDAILVDKTRYDAFVNTDLEVVLRGLGATRLLVSGIVTNACVETTVRSAAMRDLDVTVLADCCTTYSKEHQEFAVETLEYYRIARVESLSAAAAEL